MLVLSRRIGERFQIGDDIIITFLECRGSSCKIGIEAPKEIKINRIPNERRNTDAVEE